MEGGINLSVYSPNPVSWIDPWGLSFSFCSKSKRWRNNETGRYAKRPTDPSDLVRNGQIDKSNIDIWAKQDNIPDVWQPDALFPTGGFRYVGGGYIVHGHGINSNAVSKFPTGNSAQGPTASIRNTTTNEVFRTDGTWGKYRKNPNGAHIPLIGSIY